MGEGLNKWLKQTKKLDYKQEVVLNIAVLNVFLRYEKDKILEIYDITEPQYNVLRILKGVYPDGHPRCEIINRMIDPSPDITRLIDRLISKKLVKRMKDKTDMRMSVAKITEKGILLTDEITKKIKEKFDDILENVSEEECNKVSEFCEKIYGERK
ncbi:MAG TPA: MarR family transcriptional regulator [Bacteroidetes bacterium]|nr:MarR family transcriptional regulator [Ignavibacteria bacterium]HCA43694.1 MarR family transcriptional regulator [Bacteroidota bacterium]HCN37792.1 MarR family transcriptional regulator [Bacteroidota bacterium]